MSTSFKIWLAILVVALYFVGYISWRVQNDAQARGYKPAAVSFWSISVLFFAVFMLPLYIIFREKSKPVEKEDSELEKARRKLFITCPNCGEENPPELSRCQKCEKSLVGEGKHIGWKSCPYCGEQNDVNAVYCANCKQGI